MAGEQEIGKLVLRLVADIKGLKKDFAEARGEIKDFSEKSGGLATSFTKGWGQIAVIGAVISGVVLSLKSFVSEAAQAEEIENRLRFALENLGYSWQSAKKSVDAFAASIQATTRFSDEQARQALTDMLMYTNEYAKAEMGAKLAMDMSVRTGHDLSSSTRLIGMAMSGNVEMLGRYLPQLRNLDAILGADATMAEKAAYAMKVLQDKFGGTAQADVRSYAGTVAQFKNAWNDLKETLGMGLLPVLKEVFEMITKIVNAFKGFSPESASQKALDATIEKFKGRIDELKEIGNQPGLVAFQKDMIANQISVLEAGVKKLETVSRERAEAAKKVAEETKKDVFPEDYSQLLKKSAGEDAEAWGKYADSVFADMEKLQTELIRMNNEYWENRKAMESNIMAGEREAADTVNEAWNGVYQENIDRYNQEQKLLELQRQTAEVDINRLIAGIRLDRERLAIGKEDALRKEIELQKQLLVTYEDQIQKVDKITDPGGWMAMYNSIDGVRGKLNELNVALETTTGSGFQGLVRGIRGYADEIKSEFEIMRDYAKSTFQTIGDNFEEMLVSKMTGSFTSWRDVWKSLLNDMVRSWAKATRQMLENWINQFVNQLGGGATTTNTEGAPGWAGLVTGIVNLIGGAVGSIFSTSTTSPTFGGTSPGSSGYAAGGWNLNYPYTGYLYHSGRGPYENTGILRALPRFHTGLASDEILSVIKKDESVLTPAQMRAVTRQSVSVGPINVNDPRLASHMRGAIEQTVIDVLKRYSR